MATSSYPTGAADPGTFTSIIRVDLTSPGRPAPRGIAGSNVQWVDGADNLIADFARGGIASTEAGRGPVADAGVPAGPGLAAFAPQMLQAVGAIAPTSLRFPGGTHADVYHWRDGVGTVEQRGLGEHVFRREAQRMLFGTAEFLALAERIGAEPIVTVNIPTGTPEEAADWVRAVNVHGLRAMTGAGTPNQRVRFWEIGNEPYLEEATRPELTLDPAEYVRRANATIRAMKAIDPQIQVGLPLRLDRLGTVPQVRVAGYAETVLRGVTAPVDYVALHNAYLPLVYEGGAGGVTPDASRLFPALMAASRVVAEDLDNVRALWRATRPTSPLAIAVTEYGAMFSIGGATDAYSGSLAAALYAADVLRVLAADPDVIMAQHWSLSGNGVFGAITTGGVPRPTAEMLAAFRRVLRGRLVSASVSSPSFPSDAVGAVPSYTDTPVVAVLATVEDPGATAASGLLRAASGGRRVRLIVLNKSLSQPAELMLDLFAGDSASRPRAAAVAETMAPPAGSSAFDVRERLQSWQPQLVRQSADGRPVLIVPAQSITYVELDLASVPR